MLQKINFILLISVIILIVGIGGVLLWQQIVQTKPYYAVYLSTGELYFGMIDYFPQLALKNPYLLQRNENNTQTPYSIQKFSDAFWGPTEKMLLNKKNIIWKVKLKNDSQVLNYIKNPTALNNNLESLPTVQDLSDLKNASTTTSTND